ncbi:Adaptive-response sensory-kinase SasA [Methylobacterium adhaesivum]|uniref:histidine kinase n=1 Tax=Methylobacterium adhaesivum TaxID=333297 RepID=A0ABT8BFB8_9HYPH|nr:cache domain-containing protein [Methylobacterium adhaesivum]MDN3590167.1 cache domain-containing protein [Methylobacterium adhaesivum]GJD29236.1 Adaptive-response sensory-kinase SasA [Methylobacterium adhaesivum]
MSNPASGRSRLHDTLQPGTALLAAAILLPAVLFALASWQSYADALHDAEVRVERTVGILHEHAVKVFETNRLVIDQVGERLRVIDWMSEEDRAALHQLQVLLQNQLDQVATITIVDSQGRMRSSGRTYPADPNVSFADRDWSKALAEANQPLLYISRAHTGPQSGKQVFNVAGGIRDRQGAFQGVTAVSVDRSYFEDFYRSVDPEYDHNVILVREDGQILAREPSTLVAALTTSGAMMQRIRSSPSGWFRLLSQIDGVERIFSYRKVGGYPVFVGFGIGVPSALAPWRRNLLDFGIVAILASLALLAVSNLAIRQTRREQLARKQWQNTADALQEEARERERIGEQLRQAQKMESVGRLTGGIAHDFNNLLFIVVGNLDLLRQRLADGDERLVRLLSNAIDGANNAAALTHRLLAFSRQQPLDPAPVDANKLMSDMCDLVRRTMSENIAVETILADGLWPIFADANQLESIILNLAVNERDAMPDGGRITMETANAHLEEAYAALHPDVGAGEYVLIAVSDTGMGMTPDIKEKVFELFFTTKPVGKGTELGLSQVHGFVKQSGGHVSIRSEVGQGTTIALFLPRLDEARDAARACAHSVAQE